jgi:hypothetical protein
MRLADCNSMWLGLSSSDRIAHDVHRPPHSGAIGNLPQLGPSGRKETAKQPTVVELLHPALPALGTAAEPLEYPGQLCGDRSLALAKESPSLIDELDVAPQQEALQHAFAGRIQPAAVFDRAEPQWIFHTDRFSRTRNAAFAGRLWLGGLASAWSTRCLIDV